MIIANHKLLTAYQIPVTAILVDAKWYGTISHKSEAAHNVSRGYPFTKKRSNRI